MSFENVMFVDSKLLNCQSIKYEFSEYALGNNSFNDSINNFEIRMGRALTENQKSDISTTIGFIDNEALLSDKMLIIQHVFDVLVLSQDFDDVLYQTREQIQNELEWINGT